METLVAKLFNELLERYFEDPENEVLYDAIVAAAKHVAEQAMIVLSIIEDKKLPEDEVAQTGLKVISHWADGKVVDKDTENSALRD